MMVIVPHTLRTVKKQIKVLIKYASTNTKFCTIYTAPNYLVKAVLFSVMVLKLSNTLTAGERMPRTAMMTSTRPLLYFPDAVVTLRQLLRSLHLPSVHVLLVTLVGREMRC